MKTEVYSIFNDKFRPGVPYISEVTEESNCSYYELDEKELKYEVPSMDKIMEYFLFFIYEAESCGFKKEEAIKHIEDYFTVVKKSVEVNEDTKEQKTFMSYYFVTVNSENIPSYYFFENND